MPIICGFLTYFTFCQLEPIFALYLESVFNLSKTQIGYMFSMIAFGQMAGGLLIDKIKLNAPIAIIYACCITAVSVLFVGCPWFPANVFMIALGSFVAGVASSVQSVFSLTETTYQLKMMFPGESDEECSSVSSAVYHCLLGLGMTIGPIFGA